MVCEFKFIRQYGDKKLPFRRIQCLSPARNNDWMNLKKTKEVEKLQFVERMRYKKHIRIINKAGGFITRLSAFFYASRGYFKGASKRHTIYRLKWRKCPFGPIIA